MATNPTLHLNGTSANVLADQLDKAVRSCSTTLEALHDAAPNARDYYPQGPDAYKKAEKEYLVRIERVRATREELCEILESVQNQMEDRSPR